MLERLDLLGNLPATGHDGIALGMFPVLIAESKLPLLDGGLEFKGKGNLFCLDDAVRLDGTEESRSDGATKNDLVEPPVSLGGAPHPVKAPAVSLLELMHCRQIAVGNVRRYEWVSGLRLGDTHAPIGIEKASPVTVRHGSPQSDRGMLAKSGELRCPARKGAEGQSRAKQGGDIRPGVCNEHGPTPKGKMCSELGGNAERSAEMTGPRGLISMSRSISREATNCNTDYIHFVTDPGMLFEWSEPLTYPNQLTFNRLCASRILLRCTSRMFHFVTDGWTA